MQIVIFWLIERGEISRCNEIANLSVVCFIFLINCGGKISKTLQKTLENYSVFFISIVLAGRIAISSEWVAASTEALVT